ncbi:MULTISPECIES: nucleoside 2-deoxyribosyltransferase [unclassified Gemella]|uniref:nucleoside 2-deoxyribosyltransferase n=1 Tax=unclassified Gemella TaxID=2624949 RepID=UPI001C05676D|nr:MULTISPECIES: nucleoside 2-deoxyribosyltransferase [unclassified Gemella]MBU0278480.1 nucleoside 2-deoxyribosyltransferase [Gemella sp. zg-1178]QWQ39479.1 nucleoside 2-deoxyribosyltransferase [Gemella sp. zg-570]
MKLYLAGALFNEAEIMQRLKEGKILKEKFGNNLEIFNPIEQPFNENKQSLPSPEEIFKVDTLAVNNCDIFLADITNEDSGVMVELGIAIANNKKIIAINSDIRLKSANKYSIPSYAINHYVLGGILTKGKIVFSFEEALKEIENIFKK